MTLTPEKLLSLIPAGFSDPIGLGINIIVSTIVGGIVILIILEIIGKEFSEPVSTMNAFVLALLINIINMFGVVYLLGSFLSSIPFYSIILPLIIWIVLIKFLFGEMSITHAIIAGVVCYFVTMLVLPYLVSLVMGFIPL